MYDVVILGAGITALTTAHHLKKKGVGFVMLDQADRIGGVINTTTEKGFVFEEGPNSGVVGNVEVLHLFEDLKGACELEEASENVKKRYILKNGKWEALPSSLSTAVSTPLFTLKDKLRILGEPFRAAGKNPEETLADMVKRRMGQSFLDYAIDPFILGVYAGDPNRLVPKYALPKLYDLEHKYGSFIKGSIRKMFEPKTDEQKKVTRNVFSVVGGLSSLTAALHSGIGGENVQLGISALQVKPFENHFVVSYTDQKGLKVEIDTKKVISTLGAHQLEKVTTFIDQKSLSIISALHYTRVIEVILGFDNWKGMKLDAFGGLIPFKEKRDLLGVLFMSALFKNRAPKDGALFSLFLGGVRNQAIYTRPDVEIEKIVEKEICELMLLDEFKPDLFKIIRHEYAIPQYEADSGERFRSIAAVEKQFPGFIIGGNLHNGIGMADRILQARMLADRVLSDTI
jgi:protoporphyrinogen/coproporphyrinogen III oxidase